VAPNKVSGRVVKTRMTPGSGSSGKPGLRPFGQPRPGIADREIDFGPFAPADPVALHVADRLGPVDEFEVFDQSIGVGGDPEHPLLERHPDDREAADLALAVDDFFVGQDRPQFGTQLTGTSAR